MAGWECTGESNRRKVLKGLGLGAIAIPGVSGTSIADTDQVGDLNVYNVEIGRLQLDGSWKSIGNQIDTDAGFDIRVSVDGVEPSGDTALGYMTAPAGPNGSYAPLQTGKLNNPASGGDIWFTHGDPVKHAYRPSLNPLGEWPEGDYRVYATVIDRAQNAGGVGVSDTFRIG